MGRAVRGMEGMGTDPRGERGGIDPCWNPLGKGPGRLSGPPLDPGRGLESIPGAPP
jgi:hypothetical protein